MEQVEDVAAAIEHGADAGGRGGVAVVEGTEQRMHLGVGLIAQSRKARAAGLELSGVAHLERLVPGEDLFEQLGRGVVRIGREAQALEGILGACNGVAQGAVGVVQEGALVERALARGGWSARYAGGVQLAAEALEALLEIRQIEGELGLEAEELEVVGRAHQAEKEVPQPQLFLALGLSKTKPEWIRDSR